MLRETNNTLTHDTKNLCNITTDYNMTKTSWRVLKLVEDLRGRNETNNTALMLNDVILKGHYGVSYRYNYGYGYHYAYVCPWVL